MDKTISIDAYPDTNGQSPVWCGEIGNLNSRFGHLCRGPIYVEIRELSDRLAHQHWRLGVNRFGEVDIISAAD
jgi:hypothetical protein